MIDTKKSGYLVETKDGRIGRTIHEKGIINGKIPVYLCVKYGEHQEFPHLKIPLFFSETGTLFDSKKLKQIGFID